MNYILVYNKIKMEIRKVFKEELADKLWGDALWYSSYFIASAGNISVDTIYN